MLKQNLPRVKALAFAARGYPILPLYGVVRHHDKLWCGCGDAMCASPGKHPHSRLARHGKDSATTDPEIIEEWFAEHPDLNYGVCTDTLPTVDVDPRNGGDAAWLKLVRENYDVHTWRVATGGGQHIIFSSTSKSVPSGKLARGVDVKAANGYIVGVGSKHISGKRYQWFAGCRPRETELLAPPQWIVEKLAKPKWNGKPHTPDFYNSLIAPALEGERNERITALVGHLFGSAFPDRVVLCDLVLTWNLAKCNPPLSTDEVINIVRSIATRESKKRECSA